jgi:hypothetical protein
MIGLSGGPGHPLLSCLVAAASFLMPWPQDPPVTVDEPVLSGQLADLCLANRVDESVACDAYLRGMYEGIVAGQTSTAVESTSFCPPDGGLDQAEIRRIFLDFVHADGERRGEEPGWSLLNALEDDFPCDDKDKGLLSPDDEDSDNLVMASAHFPAAPWTAASRRSRQDLAR